MLGITKMKALLLVREICEKQISNVKTLHEDSEQQEGLVKLLVNICESSIRFIDSCSRITFCLSLMPVEKYKEVTSKLMAWSKLELINKFIEQVLELLKEGALVAKFDITTFITSIKSIAELQVAIEKKYIEKNEGEEVASEGSFNREVQLRDCARTRLRNECMKMILAVTAVTLSQLNPEANEEQQTKGKLIYWRLLDAIYKIDCIPGHSDGVEFLNIAELGIDQRLHNKYSVISAYMWGASSEDSASSVNTSDKRDWQSVLEAVDRDISSLNNDYKFKKLVSKIESDEDKTHIDDIYTKGWDIRGPWNDIVDKIRADFEDTELMKQKIEQQQEKVKDLAKQQLILKREKDELTVVNQSLESRLSESIMKADQVPVLEMEKKRLLEKESLHSQ